MVSRQTITRLFAIVLGGFLFACGEREDSSQMQNLPATGWEQDGPVHFIYAATDSVERYSMGIEGRIRYDYFPDKLSIVLQVTAPSGAYFRDTLSCPVPHTADRLWSDFRLPYYRHIRFTETGEWRFSITQNMNVSPIMGIGSIGIYIEKDGKE